MITLVDASHLTHRCRSCRTSSSRQFTSPSASSQVAACIKPQQKYVVNSGWISQTSAGFGLGKARLCSLRSASKDDSAPPSSSSVTESATSNTPSSQPTAPDAGPDYIFTVTPPDAAESSAPTTGSTQEEAVPPPLTEEEVVEAVEEAAAAATDSIQQDVSIPLPPTPEEVVAVTEEVAVAAEVVVASVVDAVASSVEAQIEELIPSEDTESTASSAPADATASLAPAPAPATATATASPVPETDPVPEPPLAVSSSSSSSSTDGGKFEQSAAKQIAAIKLKLYSKLASLDRGIAANTQDIRQVENVVQQLELLSGSVLLSWTSDSMDNLFGNWRLLYSSGFNTGSLGGTRPGPPAAFVPLVLGQVYQRIDNNQGFLDNIVEFMLNYNLPKLPFMSSEPEIPSVRLTLRHTFEVQGNNTVEIVYEDTSAELVGVSAFSSLPKLDFPAPPDFLKPPKQIRSAKFDVVFLDSELRITRGDRGELRVYLKDHEGELPVADYED